MSVRVEAPGDARLLASRAGAAPLAGASVFGSSKQTADLARPPMAPEAEASCRAMERVDDSYGVIGELGTQAILT